MERKCDPTPSTVRAVESALSVLRWPDILAIDKTAAKGDRAEVIPVKGGVKVMRVRRDAVYGNAVEKANSRKQTE